MSDDPVPISAIQPYRVAVSDAEIDEIWRSVADGTPIQIEP